LRLRWLRVGRQPTLLDNAAPEMRAHSGCGCALHRSLQEMRSILVHGLHDAREGTDSLYLAAHLEPIVAGGDIERFGFLADQFIAQIDVAFRRVDSIEPLGNAADRNLRALSMREEEILARVSEGRTNVEIAGILGISMFTVKNHVQRIIRKLGAANRAGAVAKHRQLGARLRYPAAAGFFDGTGIARNY
jgi:DNA-binding CsgD family transcriptional regulator